MFFYRGRSGVTVISKGVSVFWRGQNYGRNHRSLVIIVYLLTGSDLQYYRTALYLNRNLTTVIQVFCPHETTVLKESRREVSAV